MVSRVGDVAGFATGIGVDAAGSAVGTAPDEEAIWFTRV